MTRYGSGMRLWKKEPPEPPPPSAADVLRPLLYGDVPMDQWPPGQEAHEAEPWATFVRAREAYAAGRTDEAAYAWLSVVREQRVESRSALQAWTYLRLAGFSPLPHEAVTVLGVVCEVGVGGGHDVLAVYRDGSVRYLNHAGGVAVIEEQWPEARAVVDAAAPLGEVIGLWEGAPLPPLPPRHSRMLLLTPGGFRFGQGPTGVLFEDQVAGAVLHPAALLLRRIVERGEAQG